jgi:hypothetical protein
MSEEFKLIREDHSYEGDHSKVIFEDATSFSQWIERRAIKERVPCMTLILDFCEKRSVDVEEVVDLISRPLKEKLRTEAIQAGLKKKTEATLDDI